jgi:hypothetical protein
MGMRILRPATWFLKSWDLIPRTWDLNRCLSLWRGSGAIG